MKTLTKKNALKLFFFLLILFSAKAFSHPKFGNDSNTFESGSRFGSTKKTTKVSRNTSNAKTLAYKSNLKQVSKKLR